MKVLDPQAALLTVGEVHQFLKSNTTRPVDKKIGAYDSVNLHNYNVIRKDLDTYISGTTPYVLKQTPSELWMTDLVGKLKKYELTKTEVFSLLNLGIGLNEAAPPATDQEDEPSDELNGNGQSETAHSTNGEVENRKGDHEEGDNGEQDTEDGDNGEGDNEEEAATEEGGLDRMLFGLVVEESDERFAGDEGENKIAEILKIINQSITSSHAEHGSQVVNGK